jgi:hypothetical protein
MLVALNRNQRLLNDEAELILIDPWIFMFLTTLKNKIKSAKWSRADLWYVKLLATEKK